VTDDRKGELGGFVMWNAVKASLAAVAVAAALVGPSAAAAETVAMIGTGNVGAALGRRFAEHGHKIVYGSRDPAAADVRELVAVTGHGAVAVTQAQAAGQADIVVLAVPWTAAEDVVRSLPDLSGKIIVDPTNPRVTASDGFADYPPLEGSNAERIARLAPGAQVVKAFSTLGFETMLDPKVAGGPVTVPIVGDDRAAKERVAVLAREIGLEAVDVGPLRHARIIEGLHYLRANAQGGRINYHFPRDHTRD
jgi:NADPH-dependent F420 reductase